MELSRCVEGSQDELVRAFNALDIPIFTTALPVLEHPDNRILLAIDQDQVQGMLLYTIFDAFAGRFGVILETVIRPRQEGMAYPLVKTALIVAKAGGCKKMFIEGNDPFMDDTLQLLRFTAAPTTIFIREPWPASTIEQQDIPGIRFDNSRDNSDLMIQLYHHFNDIRELRTVLAAHLKDHFDNGRILGLSERRGTRFYAAFAGDKLVGMAWVFATEGLQHGHYVVDGVAVHPEYQGRGIAHQIIRQMADDADEEETPLSLTSNPTRETARSIYSQAGFVAQAHPLLVRPLS